MNTPCNLTCKRLWKSSQNSTSVQLQVKSHVVKLRSKHCNTRCVNMQHPTEVSLSLAGYVDTAELWLRENVIGTLYTSQDAHSAFIVRYYTVT